MQSQTAVQPDIFNLLFSPCGIIIRYFLPVKQKISADFLFRFI